MNEQRRGRARIRLSARALGAAGVGALLLLQACASSSSPPPKGFPASPHDAAEAVLAPRRIKDSWRDAILYFVLIDRFADGDPANNDTVDRTARGAFHGGDLRGLTQQLPEIADLGVTAIWINPVVQNIPGFVTGAGFPDWGYHGYWADDFTKIDRRFGTEEDLRDFVAACRRRNIDVLLDVVYNHAGYESKYLTRPETRDWFRSEARGTCGSDDLTLCVSGLPDAKTERPEVAAYLLGAHMAWAKASGVQGFRLDTVKHVDHPFWKEHRRRALRDLGPDFFLVGEVWGGDSESLDPWFEPDEMDAGFDFSFQGNVVSFLLGRGRTVAFDRYLKSRERTRPGHYLAHFLSSHDVPGALSLLNGDAGLFRLAAILQFTTIGIPTIYYGEEVGRKGGDWPENRSDMPWGDRNILPGAGIPRDERLRADYRRLTGIRRAHPALTRGTHTSISSDGDLLVFARRDAASGDAAVVALNRGATAGRAAFAPPAEWAGSRPEDLWTGAAVSGGPERLEVDVPAGGARILAIRRTGDPPPGAE